MASSSTRSDYSDTEDLGPEDFEHLTDEAAKTGSSPTPERVEMPKAACDDAGMSLSQTHSQTGRLARGRFIVAVAVVYLVSFVWQMLLSAPVTARMSVFPFVLVQIVLIAAWIVVHQRRLRDAGRPIGIVIGIAMIYVLEVVLLALLIWVLVAGPGTAAPAPTPAFSTCSPSSICSRC